MCRSILLGCLTKWGSLLQLAEQEGKSPEMKGKEMLNTTQKQMLQEIKGELEKGVELDEIKDNAGEWIDGYLPIYNNRIIEEWQNMPSEYDDKGIAEFGSEGERGIVGLMSLDLYLYYTDLFNEVIEELENELEEVTAQ